ncbi:MAG: 23S rRNA (uracil(1939)-C(5))-methyltransferase RlmD [Oscillospiraceae bacterium]|nr:23S rRNA (uracil(1939)-C(5))-methyltransferase RlmD [Oscillospiraceae bacterium]
MLQKNEIYEAEITGMTTEGSGVCRIDGIAVFVPMTAVGDKLRVKIVKVLKNYAFGIIAELTEPAQGRCEPDCPVFRQCGGCVFRHVTYEEELRYKQDFVQDAFTRIGKLSPEFEPILGDPNGREGYRNKAQYPVAMQDGRLVCGFYARHSHRVIPFTGCLLQPEGFAEILEYLLPALQNAGVSAYDERTNTGLLRHIYLRRGYHSGETALCFVVRKSIRRKVQHLLSGLQSRFPELVSITENINPEKTNVILGKTTQVIAGKPTISDTMCGNEIEISPQSFYQVNTAQAERLYGIAKEYAQLTGGELLLDLYCGAGTIGLSMADGAGELIGAEVVPEAVENAKENALRNGITNAQFHCGDAGEIAQMLQKQGTAPDTVVLDPPRKGCDTPCIDAVAAMSPKCIVMISCNPSTAARDAAAFAERGYAVEKVRAVDLFPGTSHVECVVLMSEIFHRTRSSFRKS